MDSDEIVLVKAKHAIPVKKEDMQINLEQKKELEKQAYRIVGHHSAVKICGWTKNSIVDRGFCYKYHFYGIRSHQCLQMTTSLYCASRCLFCWRGEKAPVAKEWYGKIDDPEEIIDQAIEEQSLLLKGFDGNPKSNTKLLQEKEHVKHVALSLTGEAITYPQINDILEAFHKRRISTFLVTNAQYPEEIKQIKNVTQLYVSLDAPNISLFKRIDRPLFPDYEQRIHETLDILSTRKYRTCIRLTAIKNYNMGDVEGYAELITKGNPDFIEIKAYMHVGASKLLLDYKDMPLMEEIKEFAENLHKLLPDYDYIAEHNPSRVVLLMKKSLHKKNHIDFGKFFDIVNSGKEATTEEYSSDAMKPND